MISKRIILLLLAIVACRPSEQAATKKSAEPKIRATVVSLRLSHGPSKAAHGHQIVIANGKARNTGERDVWRLFDTEQKTITTVDDINRTYSTETLDVLLKRQRAVLRERAPGKVPHLEYKATGEKRPMFGATAEKALATAGGYSRELWIANHPAIPRGLFSMMQASAPPTSPLAPAAAEVERELLELDGFPMVDKFELRFGQDGRFAGERVVTGVVTREVPQSVLMIPDGYRDVTPKPPPRRASKR